MDDEKVFHYSFQWRRANASEDNKIEWKENRKHFRKYDASTQRNPWLGWFKSLLIHSGRLFVQIFIDVLHYVGDRSVVLLATEVINFKGDLFLFTVSSIQWQINTHARNKIVDQKVFDKKWRNTLTLSWLLVGVLLRSRREKNINEYWARSCGSLANWVRSKDINSIGQHRIQSPSCDVMMSFCFWHFSQIIILIHCTLHRNNAR